MNIAYRRSLLALVVVSWTVLCQAAKPEWVEVRSKHFSVITDDGEKSGRGVALRFEQMRAGFGNIFQKGTVNVPVPLQIIAFRNSKEMRQYGPVFNGKPVELAGFYQGGEDRNFIGLDLSAPNGWATVFHEYAHLLLNGNVQAMPLWLDEGYADFLSTLDVQGKTMALGTFPQAYGELLASSTWLKTSELFAMTHQSRDYNEGSRRHILYAQSWLTVHYILLKNKAGQVDSYLDLMERRHLPMPDAFKQAFGMTMDQFDRELREYFHGRIQYLRAPAPTEDGGPYEVRPLKETDKDAILADFKFHVQEHVQEGIEGFKRVLLNDPDNELANRGLGYAYIRQRDFEAAAPYLKRASANGSNDARVHFYNAMLLSRMSSGMYHVDRENMAEIRDELKKSLELDPNYTEAYNLLAYTDSLSGDIAAAIKNQMKAADLSPRDKVYRMNLANYEMSAEKWDQAAEIYKGLIATGDPRVMAAAQQGLDQISQLQQWKKENPNGNIGFETQRVVTVADESEALGKPSSNGTVVFVKGKLVGVNCSAEPQAILEIRSGDKTLHLRAMDRTKLTLVGATSFSCAWKNKAVAVNYREIGEGAGDLVSLEVQ